MDDDDVVELGGSRRFRLPDWPPSRRAGVLAAAALAVGLAAGYAAAGPQHGGTARPQPTVTVTASPSVPAPAVSPALNLALPVAQDTAACSVQTGHDLQLGVQFSDRSTQPLRLTSAAVTMPAGYLKLVGWQWGTCGALAFGTSPVALLLEPGESAWLTATFRVQVQCPVGVYVQFTLRYLALGHPGTATLPGFPDLRQVPYSGCPSASAS
jgi:hypothetical protein